MGQTKTKDFVIEMGIIPGENTKVEIDGKDVTKNIQSLTLDAKVDELTQLTLNMIGDVFIKGEAEVHKRCTMCGQDLPEEE